ncbi:permease-like cell division protein FtsX [Kutzneria sp. CA-103260]|uniref:permease-like cell division protein FtsX n=1 Tax=Kutzneria sp. CA-103260 TaxID=2802641 RepID=UPI001BAAF815|nr:permease-like cell division protein FtsX [Kutzneria sp. CA-103260]QUQ65023.1 FtsX extracellular domain protein [Kutzneria sp. CA-103260]
MRTQYLVMALVLGVVAVAGVAGLAVWSPTLSQTAAPKQCGKADEVDIYLHNDAELPQVRAQVLATHQDVASVVTQTQQQTFEEFQRMFADQPDVLKTARPEALPAVVKVWPKAGASASALGDRLTQQFPPPAEIHRLICSELQK